MFGRHDGTRAAGIPAYRRIMPFLLRGRNEAAVYFEQTVDVSRALPWLEAWSAARTRELRATPFHLVLAATARTLHRHPRLNRFVSGRRLYDRRGVWLSFAAKQRMADDAPLRVVKREFGADEPFEALVRGVAGEVAIARADAATPIDREVGALLKLPKAILGPAVGLFRWLDGLNLAPRGMLARDPMYTSGFLANLGSVQLDAAYHHLYEYGNCPLFVTVGVVTPRPVVVGDAVVVRPTVRLRYSYDERIEDGFYCARAVAEIPALVADPAAWL